MRHGRRRGYRNDKDDNLCIDSRHPEFSDERADPCTGTAARGTSVPSTSTIPPSRKNLSAYHHVALVKSNTSIRYVFLLLLKHVIS